MSPSRQHLLIAGPGRSGSTLLVRVLCAAGVETQTSDEEDGGAPTRIARGAYHEKARAGLEENLLSATSYLVKDPNLSFTLAGYLRDGTIKPQQIDGLIVPLRDLEAAALSRFVRTVEDRRFGTPGGLWRAKTLKQQRGVIAEALYQVVLTAAEFELPLVVLEYPRFARDHDYTVRALGPLLRNVTDEALRNALEDVVEPSFIRDSIESPSPATVLYSWLFTRYRRARRAASLRLRRWIATWR